MHRPILPVWGIPCYMGDRRRSYSSLLPVEVKKAENNSLCFAHLRWLGFLGQDHRSDINIFYSLHADLRIFQQDMIQSYRMVPANKDLTRAASLLHSVCSAIQYPLPNRGLHGLLCSLSTFRHPLCTIFPLQSAPGHLIVSMASLRRSMQAIRHFRRDKPAYSSQGMLCGSKPRIE